MKKLVVLLSIVVICLSGCTAKKLDNLKIVRVDANKLDEIFDKEIDTIYLNFSDPWPKNRHHLRRLSSRVFLEKYDSIFREDMVIYQRTDNQALYIYSLESYSEHGCVLSDISFDLHKDKDGEELITTEYEDKFIAKGNVIYFVEVKNNGKKL